VRVGFFSRTLRHFKAPLSTHPVLLKHSVYSSSRSSKLMARPPQR